MFSPTLAWMAADDRTTAQDTLERQRYPEALKEAYQSQTDINIRTRVHLLWLVRSGWQIKAASEAVGAHYRSAQRWVEWYRDGGLDEVVSRRMEGVGQPRFLSDDQESRLVEEVGSGRFSHCRRDSGLD